MSFGFDFDLTNVSPEGSREPIEAGVYIAKIEKAEQKTSKAKAENKYINVMYRLCDNESKNGFVIFDMVTTHNSTEKAQEIGRSRLKSMFIAAGLTNEAMASATPASLVDKKVRISVIIDTDNKGEKRNKVVQVLEADSASAAKSQGIGSDLKDLGF